MTPEEIQTMLDETDKKTREDLINLMIEYTNLRQKYDKLLGEISILIRDKSYEEDISVYDIQETLKRATNA